MSPELRAKILKYKSDKLTKDLPKYEGGGYPVNFGSIAGMIGSMLPTGQQASGNFTDSDSANAQNTRTNRLNKASAGLGAAASAVNAIPIVGQIASGILGAASLGTKIGGIFSGKKAGEQETVTYAKDGGGLKRSEDYGSKDKPYPSVKSGDFAGGGRSYPIPTRADAVDALRLAGLHGRSDVKSKVYAKYPDLKKEDGGWLKGYESTITNLPDNMAAWSYKNGGSLIKFNGNTHENGGIPLDNNMKVNPNNPSAEVEDGETGDPKQNYIFSDTLKPMNTKRTFASISKSIDSKYKDKTDDIAINSKDKELARLAQQNESIRLDKESKNPLKMKGGGKLPKYSDGAPFEEAQRRDGLDYLRYQDNLVPTQPIGYGQGIVDNNPFNYADLGNIKRVGNTPGITNPFSPENVRTQAAQRVMDNTIASTPTEANKNPFGLTTGDKMQLGAGALTGITNLAMGLKKPEKFNPINLQDNGMKYIKDVRFNPNELLMNRNVGASQINQSVGSNASRIANLQNLYRGTNTQLGELAQKETLANVGQGNVRAQTAMNTSQFNAGAQERARGLNIQSKATAQNLRAKGLEDIYGSIGDVGKGLNQRMTNNIQIDTLNALSSQYGIDPETLKLFFKQKGINVI